MTRLELSGVDAQYEGSPVLREASLLAEAGQVVALVGPNGAGKSTLLRCACGLLTPTAGQVRLDGEMISVLSDRERARRIAYLAADPSVAWSLEVERLVALGRAPFLQPLRQLSEADTTSVDRAMEAADIIHLKGRRVDTLSSGERARVHLARVLATDADLILLDEPIAALDPRHQLRVMEIVRASASKGAIVILAIHALDLAVRYADQIVVMDDGRIRAQGRANEALSAQLLAEVFGILVDGGLKPNPAQLID